MSGRLVMLGGAAVFWAERQQEVVALSCIEAEYTSLCIGIKGVTWICILAQRILTVPSSQSMKTIHIDNQRCIGNLCRLHLRNGNQGTSTCNTTTQKSNCR